MRRKLLVGCSIAAGVSCIALGCLLYFTVYRPARSVLGDLDQLSKLRTMNDGVTNHEAFLTPLDGQLSSDQLSRFARVQSGIKVGLGSDYTLLEERAQRLKGLTATKEGELRARRLGVRDAILAFRGLGPVLSRAKELQVN